MGDYNVYWISGDDAFGDASLATEDDYARINALVEEEIEHAGLGHEATVLVTEHVVRCSFVPTWWAELNEAVERAFDRFYSEYGTTS
jgi:hypothetical protein